MFLNDEDARLFQEIRRRVIPAASDNSVSGQYHLCPNELVLNISEGCNLTCPYCFANQGRYSSTRREWMSRENAYATTFQALDKYPSVKVVKLFGGEPFMNLRAMEGACSAVQDIQDAYSDRKVIIGAVTNMTIFSPVHASVIKNNNILITVSVDGPEHIHDHFRRFPSGAGSFQRIKTNLSKYADYGVSPKCFESVYTPYEMNQGLKISDIVNFLINEFHAPAIHIAPVLGGFTDAQADEKRAFAMAVRHDTEELYRNCVVSEEPAKQSLVKEILSMLFSKETGQTWCGVGQRTITIAADGSVYPCYMFLSQRNQWKMATTIGSLFEETVPESVTAAIKHASAVFEQECRCCPLRDICRSCPGGIYSVGGNFSGYDQVSCSFLLGAVEGVLHGWRAKMGSLVSSNRGVKSLS